jgi:hypothetical protein
MVFGFCCMFGFCCAPRPPKPVPATDPRNALATPLDTSSGEQAAGESNRSPLSPANGHNRISDKKDSRKPPAHSPSNKAGSRKTAHLLPDGPRGGRGRVWLSYLRLRRSSSAVTVGDYGRRPPLALLGALCGCCSSSKLFNSVTVVSPISERGNSPNISCSSSSDSASIYNTT